MRSGFAAWPQKIRPVLNESNCLLKSPNNRSDGNLYACKYSILTFAPYQPTEVNEFISPELDPAFQKLATTNLSGKHKKDVDQKDPKLTCGSLSCKYKLKVIGSTCHCVKWLYKNKDIY